VETRQLKIQLAELEAVIHLIFKHLAAEGINEFEVTEDYYWNILSRDLYDLSKQPTELGVGQLFEDWEKLDEMRKGSEETVGYGLVWAASLLRRIGTEKAM
jgi:hypothetical protein